MLICTKKRKNKSLFPWGNAAITFLLFLVGYGTQLFIISLFTQKYPPPVVVEYLYNLSFITLLGTIAVLGLPAITARHFAVSQSDSKTDIYFLSKIFTMLICLCTLVIFGVIITQSFSSTSNQNSYNFSAIRPEIIFLVIPFGITRVMSAYLRGKNKIITSQMPEILIRPLLILILFHSHYYLSKDPTEINVTRLFIYSYSLTMLINILLFLVVLISQKRHNKFQIYNQIVNSKIISSNLFMGLTSLNNVGQRNIDLIMLPYFVDVAQVAIYGVVSRLSQLANVTQTLLDTVTGVLYAKLNAENNHYQNNKIYLVSSILAAIPAIILLLLVFIFGENILALLYGEIYVPGALVLTILVAGYACKHCFGQLSTFLNMTGQEVITGWVNMFSLVLNISMNLLLISSYGIIGAAVASAVSINLQALILYTYQKFVRLT